MNRSVLMIAAISLLLCAGGCRTTKEARPVSWSRQQSYLSTLRDPRLYGYSIYAKAGELEFRGGGRLHPRQSDVLSMVVKKPFRPVVSLRGSMGQDWPVLLDFTSEKSWINFSPATRLGAVPVGEREPVLVKRPGDETGACVSIIPSMRFGVVQIESPLVYVRFADGPMGDAVRGIEKPIVEGVIGWDLLRPFEQIRFDYAGGNILLFTEEVYQPDPGQLIAQIPLSGTSVCAVRAVVDGKARLVLIDPAGDFEIATDDGAPVVSLVLASGLEFSSSSPARSPGGVRIGARLLEQYAVTLSPRKGMLYIARPDSSR